MLKGAWSLGVWTAKFAWVVVWGKAERRRPVKVSHSEPDADEDRDEGADEGGENTEGPWGRRTKPRKH